jgi:hypothetical protein
MIIDRKDFDILLESLDGNDRARLTTLYNAMVNTLRAYNEKSTPTRRKDWQSAEKAFKEAVKEIEERSGAGRPDPDMVIGRISDVIRWLQSEEYCAPGRDEPIRSSKVYEDRRSGLFSFKDKTAITMTEVMAYVANADLEKSGIDHSKEIEALKRKKAFVEYRKEKENLKRLERDNAVAAGKLVQKEDTDLEKASAFGLFDALLKHRVRTDAPDWIVQIEKARDKPRALCELVYGGIDDSLDQVARMNEIPLVVKGGTDGNAESDA